MVTGRPRFHFRTTRVWLCPSSQSTNLQDNLEGIMAAENSKLTSLGVHLKKKWNPWIAARVVHVAASGDIKYLYAHPEFSGRLVPISEDEYEELEGDEKKAVQRIGAYYGHAVDEKGMSHFFHSDRSHEPILCGIGNVGRAPFFFGDWPRQAAHLPMPSLGQYIMAHSVPSRERDDTGFCVKWHRMSNQFYHLWGAIVNGDDIEPADLDCRDDLDNVGAAWSMRRRRWAVSTLEMGARCPEFRFTYHTIAAAARTDYDAPEGKVDKVLGAWIEAGEW